MVKCLFESLETRKEKRRELGGMMDVRQQGEMSCREGQREKWKRDLEGTKLLFYYKKWKGVKHTEDA